MAGAVVTLCMVLAPVAALIWWAGGSAGDDAGPGQAVYKLAVSKLASTLLIAVALWLTVPDLPGLWPIALGMTSGAAGGAAGDWFLTRRGEGAFLAGMAAFGAGHLAYAGGLWARSARIGLDGWTGGEMAAAVVLAALVALTELWLAPRTGRLRWPVRGYVVLIGIMGLSVLMLPRSPATGLLRIGAALFILSDLLLALRLFVVRGAGARWWLSTALWPANRGGQALIGCGAAQFWMFPRG